MLKYTHQFIKIRLVFHTPYPWNEAGDPQFLVVDTQRVETTIRMGQNMQMCHSLRCKQIDMSTADQLISIKHMHA